MTPARLQSSRVLIALGLTAILALSLLVSANASSHREAPLITEDPVADNTDVYAFVSPDDPDTVTLISNWIPFENPAAGPNFYRFGKDVLYQINVDNNGDAVDDVTFEFRFSDHIRNPDTFLAATGPIESLDDPDYNLHQTYSVAVVKGGERTVLANDLLVPPSNIGPRSTPDYPSLANEAIHELNGGISVFAGQRDEAFYVDLGSVFDLGGLRPFNEAHAIPLPAEPGKDSTAGFNVHSIALKVPTEYLTVSDEQPVIGVWSTTYRRGTRVFAGHNGSRPMHNGPFVQVSRLGNPLVNEVVIPLALKDAFNSLKPKDDAKTLSQPADSRGVTIPLVQDPELAGIITQLYGIETPPAPRNDLVSIFLTGIADLNQPPNVQPSEMLRLNTSIAPSDSDPNAQDRLGLLAGETDGFPNGRRLGDDTVDIALRAVAGGTPFTPDFNKSPNNALGDGVDRNDKRLLRTFPYIPHPHSGYDDPNGNVVGS